MGLIGLASEHITFWYITLGLGLVVVIAVIVLLSLLSSFVNDIDRNVKDTWDTATTVARNTATTWMLNQTATLIEDLGEEVDQHNQLLAAMGGGYGKGRR